MAADCPVYDAAVIGAGVNGSSAALHLARKGKSTVLIEQFPASHSRGSSAGLSRITRRCHLSFEAYDRIIQDSIEQWEALQKESGISLVRPHKLYVLAKKSERKELDRMRLSLIRSGSVVDISPVQGFNKKFRTSFPDDTIVMEDPDGGVLMADVCIRTIQKLFTECGGKIMDEFPVSEITIREDGLVSIAGPKGVLRAKSLVLCAGPWTSKLLQPLGIDLPLRVKKVGVFYWSLVKGHEETVLFIDISNPKGDFFGLPATEYPGMMKICMHHGQQCDPDRRDEATLDYERGKLMRYVDSNFPWLGGTPAIEEACMYTLSPDNEMIIDRHPKYNNIVFACGFSGTGFKTGPTVGKILSEMIVGEHQSFDISAFSFKRFLSVRE